MPETSSGKSAKFCGQCGTPLTPNAKFCTKCGAPAEAKATSTAQKPVAASAAPQSNRTRWILIAAVVGLLAILALTVLLNRSQQQPQTTQATQPTAAQQDIPYPDVARISPTDAFAAANAGQAVIVDVRDLESYNQAHTTGAIAMPLDELAARYTELPKDQQIILYCT